MATVRQLTTRFKFETDKRGLREFREGILGAKTVLAGLSAALGVTAGVSVFLAKVGSDLQSLAIQARAFTTEVVTLEDGTVKLYGEMADSFERMKDAIPGTETLGDFLQAFVTFKTNFPKGALSDFEVFFEAAGKLATIKSVPITEMFETLMDAVRSGDFTSLVALLPQFGLGAAKMEEFKLRLSEVDITGLLTVEQRMKAIRNLLAEFLPDLGLMSEEMKKTTAGGQWKVLKDNIRDVTEMWSGPFNKALTDLLAPVNDFFEAWTEGGATVQAFVDTFEDQIGRQIPEILLRVLRGIRSFFRDPLGLIENLEIGFRHALGLPPMIENVQAVNERPLGTLFTPEAVPSIGPLGRGAPGSLGREIQLHFDPTIIINGAIEDAQGMGRIILDKLESLIDEAARLFPQVEDPSVLPPTT